MNINSEDIRKIATEAEAFKGDPESGYWFLVGRLRGIYMPLMAAEVAAEATPAKLAPEAEQYLGNKAGKTEKMAGTAPPPKTPERVPLGARQANQVIYLMMQNDWLSVTEFIEELGVTDDRTNRQCLINMLKLMETDGQVESKASDADKRATLYHHRDYKKRIALNNPPERVTFNESESNVIV